MPKSSCYMRTLSLMLVLFIDGMGQGIIFPILNKAIISNHVLFAHIGSIEMRHIWFGIIVASYYLMWFLSAPLLGDWSDNAGRKKSLLACLYLASISFFMAALAFKIGSLLMLLISRLLGGATSGDQAIAKAAVIDTCPENKKTVYIGMILCAVTLGLVVGPLFGSYLQNSTIYPDFTIQTPLYFAMLISITNIVLLKLFFKDEKALCSPRKMEPMKVISLMRKAFGERSIRLLLLIYFVIQLGWQIFYIDMQEYVTAHLHAENKEASIALAMLGIGIFVGLSVLPNFFKKYKNSTVSVFSYSILIICIAMTIFIHSMTTLYVFNIISSASFGLGAVNILAIFSRKTDPSKQGWIMGVTGSVVALTGAIGALIAGLFANTNVNAPYFIALSLILFGVVTMIYKTVNNGSVKS